MEAAPMICHARAPDGTRIAYQTIGTGPAFVFLFPYHVNDLVRNWAVPVHRQVMRFFATEFTVINVNLRGAGQSERDIEDITFDALSSDVAAVLDDIGADEATICAMGNASPVAAHFAALPGGRVSRLVLLGVGESETSKQIFALRTINPVVGADMRASVVVGMDDAENTAALAAVIRDALSPELNERYQALVADSPVEELVRDVQVPTLVVHAAEDELLPLEAASAIAASMRTAHLTVVPTTSGFAVWKDATAVERIAAFARGTWSGSPDEAPSPSTLSAGRLTGPALTHREREVLALVSSGMTNQQVSAELYISLNTVSHHLRSIFAKTGSKNRTEAAAFAHRAGFGPTS